MMISKVMTYSLLQVCMLLRPTSNLCLLYTLRTLLELFSTYNHQLDAPYLLNAF